MVEICNQLTFSSVQFCCSVMSDSVILWIAAHQASLSIPTMELTKLMSIESVMPSNHPILCCPLLLPPSVFPSIRVLSNESLKEIVLDNLGGSSSKYLKTLRAKNRIPREEILLQNYSVKSCLSLQLSSMF